MPGYGTIRKQLSKQIGNEKAPILLELDAFIHNMKCASKTSVKRCTTVVRDLYTSFARVPEAPAEPEVEQLRAQICQLRADSDAKEQQLHTQIYELQEACEAEQQHFKSKLAITRKFSEKIFASMILGLIQANCVFPTIVDGLLTSPLIVDHLKKPCKQLLVLRDSHQSPPNYQYYLPIFKCSGRFDICVTENEFVAALAKEEQWLLVFGCGRGYISDECLFAYAGTAQLLKPITFAVAHHLMNTIDAFSQAKAVRVEVDGIRVWRPAESD